MSKKQHGNFNNPELNPCLKESKLSMECIENEFYDYSNCQLFFENYRNCTKFWTQLSRKRRSAGIVPSLPTKEERDKIVELRDKGIHVISVDKEKEEG